jgi:aryl-alcohol dehydrogenase-like predicted oxidoreductase
MKFRDFADTGWRVSEIGLGCWQIGWCWGDVSDEDARKILRAALDEGINFFDTSDTYGDGRSERFLREIIKSQTDRIHVTTKLGRRIRGTDYSRGYKHFPMEEFVDRSLLNLGVETIDLLQMHCPPVDILKENETYEVLDRLVTRGKIRFYGVSVYNLSEAVEALKNPNIKSVQLVFNIFRQQPAEWFFKLAKEKNVALIARGPLASGLLSGEFAMSTKFAENDHRSYNRDGSAFDIGDTFSGVEFEKGLLAVDQIQKLLPTNIRLSQLALKWILMHDEITVTIPGAVTSSQVISNSRASGLDCPQDLLDAIRGIYDQYIKPDVHGRWQ